MLMLKTVHFFFSIYLFVPIFHLPYWLHAQVMPSYLKGLLLHTGCLLAFLFFSFLSFFFVVFVLAFVGVCTLFSFLFLAVIVKSVTGLT